MPGFFFPCKLSVGTVPWYLVCLFLRLKFPFLWTLTKPVVPSPLRVWRTDVEHRQWAVMTSPPAQGCPGSHQEEACTPPRCGSSSGRGTSSHTWHLQRGQTTVVSIRARAPRQAGQAFLLHRNGKFKNRDFVSTTKFTSVHH